VRHGIAAAFFSPVVDWHEYAAGHRMTVDAVLTGDNLVHVLTLAEVADLMRGTADQRAGAMAGICDCLDALHAGGKRLQVREGVYHYAAAVLAATGEKRRAMLRATLPERGAEVLDLVLQAARAAGPYLKRAEPAAAPPPEPPPAPVVNVALQLPAAAVPVAIVSQPATRSVQTVERDEHDEITRTITTTEPQPVAGG
jgi:hypothetical protein